MRLVDDDGVVSAQVAVALQRVEQYAIGHHPNLGFRANPVGESHLVTDQIPQLNAKFFGDSFSNRSGRYSPRLRVGDAGAPQLEAHLG